MSVLDLAVALSLTVLCSAAVLAQSLVGPVASLLAALPLFLFLPGYVLAAALVPRTGETPATASPGAGPPDATSGPGWSADGFASAAVERTALSVVGSVSAAMLVGLAASVTPWGLTLRSSVAGLCGVTLLAGLLAAYRRLQRPVEARLGATTPWAALPGDDAVRDPDRRDYVVGAIAAGSLLFGAGTAVHAAVDPPRGETFTEFSLLTEGPDGDLVAGDYPTEFAPGQSRPVVVSIANEERARTAYEVVVEIQRVPGRGEGGGPVDREELARYSTVVAEGATDRERVALDPSLTGERLRVAFLLYRGEAPADPSTETAYRTLHLWIDVDGD